MRAKRCDEDCFHCPYPDCIVEQTQREWYINYFNERKARLKAAGLCIYCGKVPATPGFLMCDTCRAKNNDSYRRSVEKHMAEGLCINCGEKKENLGKPLCMRCYKRKKERIMAYQVKTREAWIKQGLCSICGKNPARPGLKTCLSCGEKRKARYRKRRAKNGADN